MGQKGVLTYFIAVVVVRHGDRYLLVHERKHGQLWYFPAGRVEPGETLEQGAIRETLEESGISVGIEGVLRIEHSPRPDHARVRVVYLARPAGSPEPKRVADEHSLGAAWVTLDELDRLPLRGEDVRETLQAVARGAPVYPRSLVTSEGMPWRR
jgi:ADP-ribose pyrophosphatase YjhB (NUDIX family)